MSAYDAPGIDLTLVGGGEICGTSTQAPTSTVTCVFTGRYEVYGDGTMPKRLLGTDGFYELRLADNGTAGVVATTLHRSASSDHPSPVRRACPG
jgi:hypothetical protein